MNKWKQWAQVLKRDAVACYFAARDPRTPWYVKGLALAIAAYAASPIDLIPDFVPVLGYLDDLIIIPLGIALIVRLIPPDVMAEHRAHAMETEERPVSKGAAVAIILIWIASVMTAGWFVYRLIGPGN
jgi:uncharacterized membrane protein YkvA (DUF1232 family)